MKTSLIILLLTFKLLGQSIVIYPGSASDTGFSIPSTSYTIPTFIPIPTLPPGTNSTLRYAPSLTYTLQVPVAGMYVIMLGFVEPTVQGPGLRVFSVWANDQPLLQNVDIFAEAGYLQPLIKTAVVYIPGNLTLSFVAQPLFCSQCRSNAVVSLISITGVGITDGQVQWCVASPECSGMGLATLTAQSGQPTKYFLFPTASPFLYAADFK